MQTECHTLFYERREYHNSKYQIKTLMKNVLPNPSHVDVRYQNLGIMTEWRTCPFHEQRICHWPSRPISLDVACHGLGSTSPIVLYKISIKDSFQIHLRSIKQASRICPQTHTFHTLLIATYAHHSKAWTSILIFTQTRHSYTSLSPDTPQSSNENCTNDIKMWMASNSNSNSTITRQNRMSPEKKKGSISKWTLFGKLKDDKSSKYQEFGRQFCWARSVSNACEKTLWSYIF